MTLPQFGDLLCEVTDNAYHFTASEEPVEKYLVWQETGSRALYGGGKRVGAVNLVQVTYFTKEEFDSAVEQLLNVFEEAEIAFEEPEISYEKETGYIQYVIRCEVS